MRITALLLAAILACLYSVGQTNVEDSLEKEIARHPAEDTIRINLLQSLCKQTYNTERAIAAADEIISIAKKLNLTSKEGNGYMFKAGAFLIISTGIFRFYFKCRGLGARYKRL